MKNKIDLILNAGPGIKKAIVTPDMDRDKFTSLLFILGAISLNNSREESVKVLIKDVTESELDDPCVVVIGGGKTNHTLRCFDTESDSGVSITREVLNYFDLFELGIAKPWLEYLDLVFGKNPAAYSAMIAEKITPNAQGGAGKRSLDFSMRLSKKWTPASCPPLESYFLQKLKWEKSEISFLEKIGKFLISDLDQVSERRETLETCNTYTHKGIKIFDSTTVLPGEEDPTFLVNEFLNEADPEVLIVVSNDDRGPGYALFRRNETDQIDFSQLGKSEEIVYSSKSLAKTIKPLPKRKLVKLLDLAIVD